MSTQPDHYATLRVTPDATPREIARAYRSLLRSHHPDTRPTVDDGDITGAYDAQELHAIMQAYVVLSDPAKRAAYDRARRTGAPTRAPGTPVKVRIHHAPAPPAKQRNQDQPFIVSPTRWEPLPTTTRTPRSHP